MDDYDSVLNIPLEFLNNLTLPGMPPHILKLKQGMPVILLRNLSPKLSNGTRLIVDNVVNNRLLYARIASTNEIVYIPRIRLQVTKDGSFSFNWSRTQFPISPAFAITINKSQGQTIDRAGIFLPKPVFTHGQLYVAASRVRHPANIRFPIPSRDDGKFVTRNVVYYEAL
jgi:hypothetical protein